MIRKTTFITIIAIAVFLLTSCLEWLNSMTDSDFGLANMYN